MSEFSSWRLRPLGLVLMAVVVVALAVADRCISPTRGTNDSKRDDSGLRVQPPNYSAVENAADNGLPRITPPQAGASAGGSGQTFEGDAESSRERHLQNKFLVDPLLQQEVVVPLSLPRVLVSSGIEVMRAERMDAIRRTKLLVSSNYQPSRFLIDPDNSNLPWLGRSGRVACGKGWTDRAPAARSVFLDNPLLLIGVVEGYNISAREAEGDIIDVMPHHRELSVLPGERRIVVRISLGSFRTALTAQKGDPLLFPFAVNARDLGFTHAGLSGSTGAVFVSEVPRIWPLSDRFTRTRMCAGSVAPCVDAEPDGRLGFSVEVGGAVLNFDLFRRRDGDPPPRFGDPPLWRVTLELEDEATTF